jgi:hypothetical protein
MTADEKQLRLALSIVSGRKAELGVDDYAALGYDVFSFGDYGKPSPDEVKRRAEDIFLDAIFRPQEGEPGFSGLAPDETIIQDACGDGAVEVYQGDDFVFLDETAIAAVIAIKFDLENFKFDDLIDMVVGWEREKNG